MPFDPAWYSRIILATGGACALGFTGPLAGLSCSQLGFPAFTVRSCVESGLYLAARCGVCSPCPVVVLMSSLSVRQPAPTSRVLSAPMDIYLSKLGHQPHRDLKMGPEPGLTRWLEHSALQQSLRLPTRMDSTKFRDVERTQR